MFPLFPQLPSDIRRMIWLATLGPMTLTFAKKEPGKEPVHVVSENDNGEDTDPCWKTHERREVVFPDPVALEKLSANFTRYVGHMALADGSSRLQFVVEPPAAYLACKESRAFLSFIFAEPVRPSGGLPSWFRFDIDTIRCTNRDFYSIRNHAWFTRTQHLVIAVDNASSYYFEQDQYSDEPSGDERNAEWIVRNLPLLKDIVYDIRYARTYDDRPINRDDLWFNVDHWLEDVWFEPFEEWYNCKYGTEPVSWCARVISREAPEEEWLTPTNYLRVFKLVQYLDSSEQEKPTYHRAIYLSKRTLDEFNGRIANKWGIEPAKILRSIHVVYTGLEVEMDDVAIRELKEGQDMRLEVEEIIEQPTQTKREWKMSIDDTGNDSDNVAPPAMGYVLRLRF